MKQDGQEKKTGLRVQNLLVFKFSDEFSPNMGKKKKSRLTSGRRNRGLQLLK